MTLFNLNYFHKGPISKYHPLGVKASTSEFGGSRGGHKHLAHSSSHPHFTDEKNKATLLSGQSGERD